MFRFNIFFEQLSFQSFRFTTSSMDTHHTLGFGPGPSTPKYGLGSHRLLMSTPHTLGLGPGPSTPEHGLKLHHFLMHTPYTLGFGPEPNTPRYGWGRTKSSCNTKYSRVGPWAYHTIVWVKTTPPRVSIHPAYSNHCSSHHFFVPTMFRFSHYSWKEYGWNKHCWNEMFSGLGSGCRVCVWAWLKVLASGLGYY